MVRPKHADSQLAKVGVLVADPQRGRLKCVCCGQEWSPNGRPGGRLPPRVWQCPNGCNRPAGR